MIMITEHKKHHDCDDRNKSAVLKALDDPSSVTNEDLQGCPSLGPDPASGGINIPVMGLIAKELIGQHNAKDLSNHLRGSRVEGHSLGFWNFEAGSWLYAGWSFACLLALWNRPKIFDGGPYAVFKQLRARIRAEWAYMALHASPFEPKRVCILWDNGTVTDLLHSDCPDSDKRKGLHIHTPGNRCSKQEHGATWYHRFDLNAILSDAMQWPGSYRSKWQSTSFAAECISRAFLGGVKDKWCIDTDRDVLKNFILKPSRSTAEPLVRLLGRHTEDSPPYISPPSTFSHSILRTGDGSIRSVETPIHFLKQESKPCAGHDVISGLAFRGNLTQIDTEPNGGILILFQDEKWQILD